jgi:hypothetical protein
LQKDAKIVKIYELVAEPGREEHIARHQDSIAEVEEVIFGASLNRRAKLGRYHITGQTEAGRYLSYVAPGGQGVYGLTQPEMRTKRNAEHTCGMWQKKQKYIGQAKNTDNKR